MGYFDLLALSGYGTGLGSVEGMAPRSRRRIPTLAQHSGPTQVSALVLIRRPTVALVAMLAFDGSSEPLLRCDLTLYLLCPLPLQVHNRTQLIRLVRAGICSAPFKGGEGVRDCIGLLL